jgi:hypothetical protein
MLCKILVMKVQVHCEENLSLRLSSKASSNEKRLCKGHSGPRSSVRKTWKTLRRERESHDKEKRA